MLISIAIVKPSRFNSPGAAPTNKDDNAHIEQKNWTHVRRLLVYQRYDSPTALEALNALYEQELRLFQNLFLPSVKLRSKVRVGSKLKRVYDEPQTPFQRVCASKHALPAKVAQLQQWRRQALLNYKERANDLFLTHAEPYRRWLSKQKY
jgi:hypothetical protein